jgi:cyclohexyl-isocyanide hydratase
LAARAAIVDDQLLRRVMAEIAGADYAQTVQLAIEYAPAPPFDSGRPERARPEIVAAARKRLDANHAERTAAVLRAAASLASREISYTP